MNVAVHVSPEVAAAWPEYRAVVVIAESERLIAGAERVAAWRRVFSEFVAKPSRYPSSAEALLARVLKGGEDLDELRGDLHLVRTDEGEVAWRDDEGITCRRWNWRQEPRTRLTDKTTNAFFVFDQLPPQRSLANAVQELLDQLRERGAETRIISAPS
jgi:DNA/RNA-binding domain of Phe-tRNA-synthetase-like protein